MPVKIEELIEHGQPVEDPDVQGTVFKLIKHNEGDWITSREIEEVTKFRRQSINQAIRSLVKKGDIERKIEEVEGFSMNKVRYVGDDDEHQK